MSAVHLGLMIAGISGVAAPIVIHLLFRQRRKVIKWGAMRYLMEAFRRARKRMRLEQLLLLLIRCAMVVLFGLAIGRLFFPSGVGGAAGIGGVFGGGGRVVYLLIDNGVTSQVNDVSLSQGGPEAESTALERFKATGEKILNSLSSSDRAAILTLARPVEGIVDPPVVDVGAVRRVLSDIEATDSPTDYAEAFLRLRQSVSGLTDQSSPVVVYLLSDFYKGAADLGSPMEEMLRNVNRPLSLYALKPADGVVDNVGVVSVDPVRTLAMSGAADGSGQIRVGLRRSGDVSRVGVSSVRLVVSEAAGAVAGDEGLVRDQQMVSWGAGVRDVDCEFRLAVENLEAGRHGLSVMVDGDRFGADDRRVGVFEIRDHLRVGIADRREFGGGEALTTMSAGAWFRRALAPGDESTIEVVDIDPTVIEPASLAGLDALILSRPDLVTKVGWKGLGDFVGDGGLLWIVPQAGMSVALWPDEARGVFDLSWVWGREAVSAGGGDGNEASMVLDKEQPKSGLLRMLAGEVSELVKPVRIYRYLPIEEGVSRGSVVLRMGAVSGSIDNKKEKSSLDPGRGSTGVWMAATTPVGMRGLVVYLASPPSLSWTSLPAKPFMVALVQEVIRQGLSEIRRGSGLLTGGRPVLHVPSTGVEMGLGDEAGVIGKGGGGGIDGGRVAIVREREVMRPSRALVRAGLYGVVDVDGNVVDWLAVNVDPARMLVEAQGADDVMSWLGHTGDWKWVDDEDAAAGLAVEDARSELSFMLLIIVLFLAVVETVLARWFSHAYRRDFAAGEVIGNEGRFDTLKDDAA